VNLAAKLRAKSRNGDVVLSHAIAGYPAIGRLLKTLPTREESLAFRGFDEPVRLVRVLPRAGRSSATVQPWLSGWAGAQVRPETCHELDGR
jgi:class 3 adenylate cyclase